MAIALWLRQLPDDLAAWLVFIGIFVSVILLVWFQQRHRRKGLERAAREMGFTFHADAAGLGATPYLHLPLLERNTALSNVLTGAVSSGEIVLLECRVGSGKAATTQTVACLRLSGKQLPAFELGPENIFHKIGSMFGYKDIDFPENEGFSKSYLLRGTDESAVRMLFHPGRLSFFEQHKGWSVEGAGEWLAIYKSANTIEPSKLRAFVEEATQITAAFL